MADPIAYKVLTDAQMQALKADAFQGAPIDIADGYIHLSSKAQLAETVSKHFAGQSNLWVAAVDLVKLGGAVKWEKSRGDALFPHIYGPLAMDAVLAYGPLTFHADGSILLPEAS